jgi:SAM-dependent methyltransferase
MTEVIGNNPSHYWDELLGEFQDHSPALRLWRAYMREVYGRLIRNWLGPNQRLCLKTDLFEEAVSEEGPLADLGPNSLGIDGSSLIVQAARQNLARHGLKPGLLVGDLRHIPFKNGALSGILSGSSLDHFADPAEIAVSLAELRRILAPGGTLVITFDNPHNPVVWLRNGLPFIWLNRIGLVPYYVGPTYTRAEAYAHLTALGFKVTKVTAVAHAPRVLAMVLVRIAERLGWPALQRAVSALLQAFEVLERLPTRYLTGYYVALQAVVSA